VCGEIVSADAPVAAEAICSWCSSRPFVSRQFPGGFRFCHDKECRGFHEVCFFEARLDGNEPERSKSARRPRATCSGRYARVGVYRSGRRPADRDCSGHFLAASSECGASSALESECPALRDAVIRQAERRIVEMPDLCELLDGPAAEALLVLLEEHLLSVVALWRQHGRYVDPAALARAQRAFDTNVSNTFAAGGWQCRKFPPLSSYAPIDWAGIRVEMVAEGMAEAITEPSSKRKREQDENESMLPGRRGEIVGVGPYGQSAEVRWWDSGGRTDLVPASSLAIASVPARLIDDKDSRRARRRYVRQAQRQNAKAWFTTGPGRSRFLTEVGPRTRSRGRPRGGGEATRRCMICADCLLRSAKSTRSGPWRSAALDAGDLPSEGAAGAVHPFCADRWDLAGLPPPKQPPGASFALTCKYAPGF
jgi:hypothetical protein